MASPSSAVRGARSTPDRAAPWLWLAIVVGLGAVGIALISQHHFDMQPCPWCVLQRLIFVAIALVAALALIVRGAGARLVAALAMLALAVGGMVSALWQHFVAAATATCNLTFPDRLLAALKLDAWLPEIFQPRASCADAAVDLLGVPYEFWSLALFAGLAFVALRVLRGRATTPRR